MKRWSEILGHDRPLGVLSRAIESGRLHHAYLFTGPPGVGKFTAAWAMAAVLNCEKRPPATFSQDCGQCSACRRIADRQHPDVLFVEPPNRVITIGQIRDVQKASASTPYEGRFRAVLVDEAHAMTEEAANALLKTLEEPSDRTLLFLITDRPHRLLETIISRCQRMRFGAIDETLVADALDEVADGDEIDDQLLSVAAGYGEGSLGRSMAMLQSGMLADRRSFLDQIFSLQPDASVDWLDLADEFSEETDELEYRIEILTVFFRDVMLAKRAESSRIINTDLRDLVQTQATRFSLDAVLTTLDALMAAKRRLQRHVNPTLVTEDLLDRLRKPDSQALASPR